MVLFLWCSGGVPAVSWWYRRNGIFLTKLFHLSIPNCCQRKCETLLFKGYARQPARAHLMVKDHKYIINNKGRTAHGKAKKHRKLQGVCRVGGYCCCCCCCCCCCGCCGPSARSVVGASWGEVGPACGYVGPSSTSHCRGYVDPSSSYVDPSWGYVGRACGPCWAMGVCWAMLTHLDPQEKKKWESHKTP